MHVSILQVSSTVQLYATKSRLQQCRKKMVYFTTLGAVLLYVVAASLCLGATGMLRLNMANTITKIKTSTDLAESLQNIELYQVIAVKLLHKNIFSGELRGRRLGYSSYIH